MDDFQPDPELSHHFQYSEQVNAAYASISGLFLDKTEVQLGLRVEQTHSVSRSLSIDQKVELDYLNLFPNLFIFAELSETQDPAFSYGYRIDRPNFQNFKPSPLV